MIKRVLTVAAALTAVAGVAQADDTVNGTLNVSATVANTCYIRSVTPSTLADNATFAGGGAGAESTATLTLSGQTVNPDTAIAVGKSYRLGVSAYCNWAGHGVGLRSQNGGLTRATAATVEGDFEQRIPYNATLTGWGTTSLSTLNATGDRASQAAVERKVNSGALNRAVNTTQATLTIDTLAGVNPLVEGAYSDVLTVRLGSAL